MKKIILQILLVMIFISGCAEVSTHAMDTNQSQAATRNYQARKYESSDKKKIMQAIINTMMDLEIIIHEADDELGIISGSSSKYHSSMTVTIRLSKDENIIVRANAQQYNRPIESPIAYQNFFNSLSQSLFLEAHEVE